MEVAVEARLYAALGEATLNPDPAAAWAGALEGLVADGTIDAREAERWSDRIEPDAAESSNEVRQRARAYATRLVDAARDSDPYDDEQVALADTLAALRTVGAITEKEEVDWLDKLEGDAQEASSLGELQRVLIAGSTTVTAVELWTNALVVRVAGIDGWDEPRVTDDRGTAYRPREGMSSGSAGHWVFDRGVPAEARKLTMAFGGTPVEVDIPR